MSGKFSLFFICLFAVGTATVSAEIVSIFPLKDNTILEQLGTDAPLSGGNGNLFVGKINQTSNSLRRGLVQFDVAGNIPLGATITGVTLTMTETSGMNGSRSIELHRLLSGWGEGTSAITGGNGAPATNGDATWFFSVYNTDPLLRQSWANPGGDFVSAPSGAMTANPGQSVVWSSATDPQILTDVQSWLSNPGANFGWLIQGVEETQQSVKRFGSRELAATPPTLSITFTTAVTEPATITALLAVGIGAIVIPLVRRRR